MSKYIVSPRDYQAEGLDLLKTWYWKHNLNRLACIMATGMGKTSGIAANLPLAFPELAEHRNGEGGVLFIVHRIEIIRQAKEKFEALFPDRWIGLEQGENHCTGYEDFVFASVDSLGRLMSERIWKYQKRKFGMIIVDEAHHVEMDNTWDNILTYFGAGSDPSTHFKLSNGLKPLVTYLTATPSESMVPFIDRCDTETGAAFNYDILYGVRNGWLVDIRAYKAAPKGVDLSLLSPEAQVDYIVKTYEEYAKGTHTLGFARNVMQSRMICDTLNALGLSNAMHVDANETILPDWVELPPNADPRKYGLELYERREIDSLWNRLVFTEGWDAPGIQTIIDNAPTTSQTLFAQKIGRGLRPSADARVDDYATAEERRAAIARSSKDALTFIQTYDPMSENSLTIVAALWNGPKVDTEDGLPVVKEVIDVIELIEREHPERPIGDAQTISELKIALQKVDVWSQTIENPKLKAITPLRWVIDGDDEDTRHASLYLPMNPRATNVNALINKYNVTTDKKMRQRIGRRIMAALREHTAVVWRFQQEGDGEWRFYEIIVGGWVNYPDHMPQDLITTSRKDGFVAPARVTKGKVTTRLSRAIRRLDGWLEQEQPELYRELKRGANSPATEWQKNYLRTNGVRFGPQLTEENANILIDNFRIQRKLTQIRLD